MASTTTVALQTSVAGFAPISGFAQENSAVLPRSFLIAVVVVAPLAFWQWSRIRARRQAAQHNDQPEPIPDPDPSAPESALEALVTDIGRIGRELESGDSATIRIPQGITVAGRSTDRALVDQLVGDALTRSGLFTTDSTDSTDVGGDRVLECRKQ